MDRVWRFTLFGGRKIEEGHIRNKIKKKKNPPQIESQFVYQEYMVPWEAVLNNVLHMFKLFSLTFVVRNCFTK